MLTKKARVWATYYNDGDEILISGKNSRRTVCTRGAMSWSLQVQYTNNISSGLPRQGKARQDLYKNWVEVITNL